MFERTGADAGGVVHCAVYESMPGRGKPALDGSEGRDGLCLGSLRHQESYRDLLPPVLQ